MNRDQFWLTDEQFSKIEPHLPADTRGKARVDDRRVISGIVHVLKSGGRWIDAPAEYGPRKSLYNGAGEEGGDLLERLSRAGEAVESFRRGMHYSSPALAPERARLEARLGAPVIDATLAAVAEAALARLVSCACMGLDIGDSHD